jgi:hypothetical protein
VRLSARSGTGRAKPTRLLLAVFGPIGDDFVVATDEKMARPAASLVTETLEDDAAGAVRIPVRELLLSLCGPDAKAFADLFEDLVATISADPEATVATAPLEIRDSAAAPTAGGGSVASRSGGSV